MHRRSEGCNISLFSHNMQTLCATVQGYKCTFRCLQMLHNCLVGCWTLNHRCRSISGLQLLSNNKNTQQFTLFQHVTVQPIRIQPPPPVHWAHPQKSWNLLPGLSAWLLGHDPPGLGALPWGGGSALGSSPLQH